MLCVPVPKPFNTLNTEWNSQLQRFHYLDHFTSMCFFGTENMKMLWTAKHSRIIGWSTTIALFFNETKIQVHIYNTVLRILQNWMNACLRAWITVWTSILICTEKLLRTFMSFVPIACFCLYLWIYFVFFPWTSIHCSYWNYFMDLFSVKCLNWTKCWTITRKINKIPVLISFHRLQQKTQRIEIEIPISFCERWLDALRLL